MRTRKKSQQVSPVFPQAYWDAAVKFRIGYMSRAGGNSVEDLKNLFRAQEAAGLLTILHMDDEVMLACWHDAKIARAVSNPVAQRVVQ